MKIISVLSLCLFSFFFEAHGSENHPMTGVLENKKSIRIENNIPKINLDSNKMMKEEIIESDNGGKKDGNESEDSVLAAWDKCAYRFYHITGNIMEALGVLSSVGATVSSAIAVGMSTTQSDSSHSAPPNSSPQIATLVLSVAATAFTVLGGKARAAEKERKEQYHHDLGE